MAESGKFPKNFDTKFNRQIRNVLFDFDDAENEHDFLINFCQQVSKQAHSEAVGGWMILTEPKVSVKKKNSTVTGTGNGVDVNRVDYVSNNIRKTRGRMNAADALKGGYFERSLWKGCADPRTFHYIHNNGKYRRSKALIQGVIDHKLPKNAVHDNFFNMSLQHEIHQELPQEYEMLQTQGHWAKAEIEIYEKNEAVATKHNYANICSNKDEKERNQGNKTKCTFAEVSHSASSDNEKAACPKSNRQSSSPVHLPTIYVPLVSSTLVRSRLSESFKSKINLVSSIHAENSKDGSAHSGLLIPRKTRRSLSEPPPPKNYEKHNRVNNVELCPLRFTPEHSSASYINASMTDMSTTFTQEQKVSRPAGGAINSKPSQYQLWSKQIKEQTSDLIRADAVLSDVLPNNHGLNGKPSFGKESLPQTEKVTRSHTKTLKRMKTCKQPEVSKAQPRYISAASEEVIVVPQLQQDNYQTLSTGESTADVRNIKENRHNITSSTFMTDVPPKTRSGTAVQNPKSQAARSVASFPQYSVLSSSFVSKDSFRAHTIGRVKPRKRVTQPSTEYLPEIAGQKYDISITNHKIV